MKHHQREELRTRRDFVRQSACAALGVTGLVNALAHMRLITAALAQGGGGTGYKALVCLFLNGGNDSNNLIVPAGDPASDELRADYEAGRGILALDRAALHPVAPLTANAFARYHGGAPHPLGFHPNAAGLKEMFDAGDLAVVSNVGTLAYPIPARSDYIGKTVPVPPQLFSHSDQQTQWQSSIPDKPFQSGWGGRAAELLHDTYNLPEASKVSMSISLAGVNSFQVGTGGSVVQYIVRPTGTVALSGYNSGADPYGAALDAAGNYKTTTQGHRLKAFEQIMRLTHENLLEEHHNRIVESARVTEGFIGAAMTAAAASGVDFDAHFAGAANTLGDQLKMVAKLIAGRSALGNNRQIFFCQVGGYDTHQTMLSSHGNLMAELGGATLAFRNAMAALGLWENVVAFTASDFNRTLTPNGTDATNSGSDHAWGGHALVMGGAVRGGDVYGHFPSLKRGDQPGSIDAHTDRGRWIPSVSVDQYSAVLAKWMGAGSSEIETIFPNLPRFDDPFASSPANLGFL